MSKHKRNSFEQMGLNPEVMAKFGYEDLDAFLNEEAKISPE